MTLNDYIYLFTNDIYSLILGKAWCVHGLTGGVQLCY